ncbi:metallophosphoesterase [uncultured Marinobacter sp.]|uniref:metallophosphoesterase n=1 Tax=uncultured Marinobacter sp. TaxID=187379 RepID=UPI0030DC60DD
MKATIESHDMRRDLIVHQRIERNSSGRDWVCGDLHGRYADFRAELEESGFNPSADRLFLLGDLIDRGPQSLEMLLWALETNHVHSTLGNHELLFMQGATHPGYRDKHRALGGGWADDIDFSLYRRLTTGCANQFPLTMTLECEHGTLGLVHAQSPFDDWQQLSRAEYSDPLAIQCTWPWSRVKGANKPITGVSVVVSGHIGTHDVVTRANQIWIDTLEASGRPTLITADNLLAWMQEGLSND